MKGIYIVGRYPDREGFIKCFHAVKDAGFDFIEIGIPFNDPIADGPVIAGAILEAIEKGAIVADIMDDIISLKEIRIDKYVMTYSNIIYSCGVKNFSDTFAGILKGLIIADLPNRMSGAFYNRGLAVPVVPFATLETRPSDMAVLQAAQGDIIYFVGVRGITGSQADLSSREIKDKIKMIRYHSDKKIIIGFGIKNKKDVEQAMSIADGFVVGTEAVKRQKNPDEFKTYLETLMG